MIDLLDWPQRLEAYLNDHFPARSALIRLNSRIRLRLGMSGSPDVEVGRKGWLFLKQIDGVLDTHQGLNPLSDSEISAWIEEYSRRKEWLEEHNIHLRLIIVPNKHSIYPEYLPARYKKQGPSRTDQLTIGLDASDVGGIVDLRPLFRNRKQPQGLYPRLNTHWTDWGSYLGYRATINSIRSDLPRINEITEGDLESSAGKSSGDLGRLLGLGDTLSEPITQFSVRAPRATHVSGTNFREEVIHYQGPTNAPKALVLCDSFVDSYQIDFLRESFSDLYYTHHGRMSFSPSLVLRFKPDVVIYLIVERLLPRKLK